MMQGNWGYLLTIARLGRGLVDQLLLDTIKNNGALPCGEVSEVFAGIRIPNNAVGQMWWFLS
jgi:hypothetical protein